MYFYLYTDFMAKSIFGLHIRSLIFWYKFVLSNSKRFRTVIFILSGDFFSEYFLLDNVVNVVCVDWSELSFATLYFIARFRCKEIGNYVAELILMLTNNTSQSMDNIHIIGFSMGAHIAGFAGKQVKGQVQRITGININIIFVSFITIFCKCISWIIKWIWVVFDTFQWWVTSFIVWVQNNLIITYIKKKEKTVQLYVFNYVNTIDNGQIRLKIFSSLKIICFRMLCV